jgi:hypothetical protein
MGHHPAQFDCVIVQDLPDFQQSVVFGTNTRAMSVCIDLDPDFEVDIVLAREPGKRCVTADGESPSFLEAAMRLPLSRIVSRKRISTESADRPQRDLELARQCLRGDLPLGLQGRKDRKKPAGAHGDCRFRWIPDTF